MTERGAPLRDKRVADHSAFQVWLPLVVSMGGSRSGIAHLVGTSGGACNVRRAFGI